MSRHSTLLREDVLNLSPKIKDLQREQYALIKQREILYEGNPELDGTCVICDTLIKGTRNKRGPVKKTDHFVSAVVNKSPRYRNEQMLNVNDPINMVYCCPGKCNNETNKAKRLNSSSRLQKYYEFVLNECLTTNINKGQFDEHSRLTIKSENERLERCKELLRK